MQARARGWAQRRAYRATVAHLEQLKVRHPAASRSYHPYPYPYP